MKHEKKTRAQVAKDQDFITNLINIVRFVDLPSSGTVKSRSHGCIRAETIDEPLYDLKGSEIYIVA